MQRDGRALTLTVPLHFRNDIAYNAAHDIGEALPAAFAYRTSSGAGQHAAVGLFLEDIRIGTDAAKPSGNSQADLATETIASLLAPPAQPWILIAIDWGSSVTPDEKRRTVSESSHEHCWRSTSFGYFDS